MTLASGLVMVVGLMTESITIFGMKFGEMSVISAIVYGLVGLAGIYQAVSFKAIQRRWHGQPSLQHSR